MQRLGDAGNPMGGIAESGDPASLRRIFGVPIRTWCSSAEALSCWRRDTDALGFSIFSSWADLARCGEVSRAPRSTGGNLFLDRRNLGAGARQPCGFTYLPAQTKCTSLQLQMEDQGPDHVQNPPIPFRVRLDSPLRTYYQLGPLVNSEPNNAARSHIRGHLS